MGKKPTRQEPVKKVVAEPVEKPVVESSSGFRPVDYTLAGVYGFLAGASLWSLFMGCKGNAPIHPALGPHCGTVAAVEFPLLTDLYKTWNSEVYRAPKSDAVEYLHFVSIIANMFAVPLMFAMLLGPKGNGWQKFGLMHATALLIANSYFFMAGVKAKPTQRQVFDIVYTFQVALPIILMFRWLKEKPFERKAGGFIGGFISFIFKLGSIVALLYTVITVYDWAVSSHKDLKGFQKVSPHFDEYIQQASYHVEEFSKIASEKAQELGKVVTAKISGQ